MRILVQGPGGWYVSELGGVSGSVTERPNLL
jgi:hypothetical protein